MTDGANTKADTLGESVRGALGNGNMTKDETLKHVEESWDDVKHNLHDFFLTVPHDANMGVPKPKEKMSKEEAIKYIEECWEHPYQNHLGKKPKEEHYHVPGEKEDKRTLGQKVHDFFLVVPNDKNLGLPQKQKMPKEEALKKIEECWDHPLESFDHPMGYKAPEEHVDLEGKKKDKRTFGQKLYDFLFVAPTDENMGVPHKEKKMSKEEALKAIEHAWDHPLGG